MSPCCPPSRWTCSTSWMDDVVAAGLPEPTAMVLATVSADQRPRARMVLLKSAAAGRVHLLHQQDLAQGQRPGRGAAGLPGVPLVRRAPAGDHRGPGGAAVDRRQRAVLPQPPARLPAGRLGQPSVGGAVLAGRARGPVRRAGAALAGGNRDSDAGVLGRLPAAARSGWSSGRAGRAGCTTASATRAAGPAGRSAGWLRDNRDRPARNARGTRVGGCCRAGRYTRDLPRHSIDSGGNS